MPPNGGLWGGGLRDGGGLVSSLYHRICRGRTDLEVLQRCAFRMERGTLLPHLMRTEGTNLEVLQRRAFRAPWVSIVY